MPDELPAMLADAGVGITEQSAVDEVWEAISIALDARAKLREQVKEQEAFDKFEAALLGNESRATNQNATRPIPANDLVVGDKFKVKGKWVAVTDLTEDGFVLEHEEFQERTILSPKDGDEFFADLDLIYAADFEVDPFSAEDAFDSYVTEQTRKGKQSKQKPC